MSTFSERLEQAMIRANVKAKDLVRALKCSPAKITTYTKGTRHPPEDVMLQLAMFLKVDPSWLAFGESPQLTKTRSEETNRFVKMVAIPVLKIEEAENWKTLLEKYAMMNNQGAGLNDQVVFRSIYVYEAEEARGWAFEVEGDAMVSTIPGSPSFIAGTVVVVSPYKYPKSGDFVIARPPLYKSAILRQYVNEGGAYFLKALNTAYPTIQIDNLGCVLATVIRYEYRVS